MKNIVYEPIRFTKVIYAENKSVVIYNKPPESIPIGCWCKNPKCKKIGPFGHKLECSLPNLQSLKLTLGGFIKCLYSPDKKYRTKLRDIKNEHNDIKNATTCSGRIS